MSAQARALDQWPVAQALHDEGRRCRRTDAAFLLHEPIAASEVRIFTHHTPTAAAARYITVMSRCSSGKKRGMFPGIYLLRSPFELLLSTIQHTSPIVQASPTPLVSSSCVFVHTPFACSCRVTQPRSRGCCLLVVALPTEICVQVHWSKKDACWAQKIPGLQLVVNYTLCQHTLLISSVIRILLSAL
jgi:hypothetical protein